MAREHWREFLPESVVKRADAPIYHYTDARGLLGIVQDKVLWATEASGLNDVAEVVQGWDFIRAWLKTQDPDDDVIGDMIEVALGDGSDDEDDWVRSRDGVYVCSASLLGDDANQWRLYGGAARGYAVEFNPMIPLAPFAEGGRPEEWPLRLGNREFWMNPIAPTRVTPWLHVLYSDVEKETALAGLVENARTALERIVVRVGDGELNEVGEGVERQVAFASLRSDLALLARLMKSPGFAGEQEVRMIVSEGTSRVVSFRGTPRGVVRYSRLVTPPKVARLGQAVYSEEHPPDNWTALPIRSVRIGPLIRTSNNRGSITALLAGHPGGPSVTSSKVPLGG